MEWPQSKQLQTKRTPTNLIIFIYLLQKVFWKKKNLTIKFLKIKMQEYDSLLKELENEKNEK